MFRRDAVAAQQSPAETSVPAQRREKSPAHESKIYTEGSTFAERRAKAAANGAERAQRRLASLGLTEFPQRNQRTGETEYLDAEMFMDVDKPMERFVRIAGVPGLHPLHSTSGKEDKATPIPGRVRTNGPSLMSLPSQPDPPARPV